MELSLAQCARCRRVFPRVRSAVCPDCEPDEDADLERIRKVLETHSELRPEEVARLTEVSIDCVLRLLDEGRVTNTGYAEARRCERCGSTSLEQGRRLCQACLIKLDSAFTKAVNTTWMRKRERDEEAHRVHEMLEKKRRTPPKKVRRGFIFKRQEDEPPKA